jgi:hypothetical protein
VKLTRARVFAIVMGSLLLLWGAALFLGLPFLYAKKVEALVGQDLLTVRQELGAPKQEWAPADYTRGPARGGPVLLYADKEQGQGWYLYFDESGKLTAFERPDVPDAG